MKQRLYGGGIMQSGLPLTSEGYWNLATHQMCSTFLVNLRLSISPSVFLLSLSGTPYLSSHLSQANSKHTNELDNNCE